MIPTDTELETALMALRAIAYQAEHHLDFLKCVAAPQDTLDQYDLNHTQDCLNALNPAILWLGSDMQVVMIQDAFVAKILYNIC